MLKYTAAKKIRLISSSTDAILWFVIISQGCYVLYQLQVDSVRIMNGTDSWATSINSIGFDYFPHGDKIHCCKQ